MVRGRWHKTETGMVGPMLTEPVLAVSRATPVMTTYRVHTGLAPSSEIKFRDQARQGEGV